MKLLILRLVLLWLGVAVLFLVSWPYVSVWVPDVDLVSILREAVDVGAFMLALFLGVSAVVLAFAPSHVFEGSANDEEGVS